MLDAIAMLSAYMLFMKLPVKPNVGLGAFVQVENLCTTFVWLETKRVEPRNVRAKFCNIAHSHSF